MGKTVAARPMGAIKKAAANKLIDFLLNDPENNLPKATRRLNAIIPDSLFASQRAGFAQAVEERNNWYELLLRIADLNPEVAKPLLKTFFVDANLEAWPIQEQMREKHQCNIPWAILLDPTSACNLHCTGCWAADYGHKLNLSFEEIDSIICQGKELGVRIYIYTGGEPLVRKRDLIRLCEKHRDCAFLCFTNATLIDEEFCEDMIRVKNFVPAISAEGDESATDARRGKGTYEKVETAMDLLREHGLPFGVSICYTHANAHSVATEEYFDWLIGKGALFAWIFTFMPVGVNAPVELMPTPEDRKMLYSFNRKIRETKPILTLDFQHDGEFVGGCIAGGRRYLHINAAGDVEPCVFVHYSNANIRDNTLLECLKSPIFMEYYRHQPFNDNLLRPCPMLENPECLEHMVRESGARSTDLEHKESVEDLCGKCRTQSPYWAFTAEEIWTDANDPRADARHYAYMGQAESDKDRLESLGRTIRAAFDSSRDTKSNIN